MIIMHTDKPHLSHLSSQICIFKDRLSSSDDAKKKSMACGTFCLISLACGAFFFIKKLACGAYFPLKIFFLIILWFEVSYSVMQFIGGENDSWDAFERSASVLMIWVTRYDCDSGEQTTWIKQSLPQRYVCVGCQPNSDQALRLLCLKGHVRARDSTLWRYRWQGASEFLCTKTLFLEGVEEQKNRPKPPEKPSQTR